MNASKKSHAELDAMEDLDEGDANELAGEVVSLGKQYGLNVFGGCCGTDNNHIEAIAASLRVWNKDCGSNQL